VSGFNDAFYSNKVEIVTSGDRVFCHFCCKSQIGQRLNVCHLMTSMQIRSLLLTLEGVIHFYPDILMSGPNAGIEMPALLPAKNYIDYY
jgi:hypothetical protein